MQQSDSVIAEIKGEGWFHVTGLAQEEGLREHSLEYPLRIAGICRRKEKAKVFAVFRQVFCGPKMFEGVS
ncbi:hypothetical protein [Cypionkella sp.]|uniref:hypothetical protein n=1 Tax=Cypionkella sp. TaxID=2811411 RepID=UPI003753AC0A